MSFLLALKDLNLFLQERSAGIVVGIVDFGFTIDLDSRIIPCRNDFTTSGFGLDVEFGSNVRMDRGIEDDKNVVLDKLGTIALGSERIND